MSEIILPDDLLVLIFSYSEITELQILEQAFPHLVNLELYKLVLRNFVNENRNTQDPLLGAVVGLCQCFLTYVQSVSLR